MGIEHFYWFIDREVIDPVLEMSWKAFLSRYPWRRKVMEELLTFAVDPEPNSVEVSQILEKRSLRWTIQRSSPAYFLLSEIVDHVPHLRQRSRNVLPNDLYEVAVLEATAVDAFLEGRIGEKTLWAVYNVDGRENPINWLRLSRSELWHVEVALGYGAVERPIFSWQSDDCLEDGYRCLRVRDTRRFIDFVCQRWEENCQVPRLRDDVRERLGLTGETTPRFRDFDLSQKLFKCVKSIHFDKFCVLRYFR